MFLYAKTVSLKQLESDMETEQTEHDNLVASMKKGVEALEKR